MLPSKAEMMQETRDQLLAMKADGSDLLDVSLSNGLVRSSKELSRIDQDTWRIFHDIDGTITEFTLDQAAEVVLGLRSPWEGTVVPDTDFWDIVDSLPKEEIIDVFAEYDLYLENARSDGWFAQGWVPVCVSEFYESEYPTILTAREDDPDV